MKKHVGGFASLECKPYRSKSLVVLAIAIALASSLLLAILLYLYNSSNRGMLDIYDPFLFTEGHDLYYGYNVKALQKSLHAAIAKGCLKMPIAGNTSERIHVVMNHKIIPATRRYIQVQLEQHTSGWMTAKYLRKLDRATQIWEMSPRGVRLLVSRLPTVGTKTFAIPTTTYIDAANPFFQCGAHWSNRQRPSGSVEMYSDGCYYTWDVSGSKQVMRQIKSGNCGHNRRCLHVRPDRVFLTEQADVVFYGALMCSHGNRREKLCDLLQTAGLNVACLSGVFDKMLTHYVCNAKVVVLEHFYDMASLETHRIDALLLAGKIVITTPSGDPYLDRSYQKFVMFRQPYEFATTIQSILKNWGAYEGQRRQRRERFILWMEKHRSALCNALRQLHV